MAESRQGNEPEVTPRPSSLERGRALTVVVRLVAGLLLCAVGVIWIGQGVGAIHGSFMTGSPFWAVVGALCLIAGLALLARAAGIRRRRQAPDT